MSARCKGCGGPAAPLAFWTENPEGVVHDETRLCPWCFVERRKQATSASSELRRTKRAKAPKPRTVHPALAHEERYE